MATTEKDLHGLQTTKLEYMAKFFKMRGSWRSSFQVVLMYTRENATAMLGQKNANPRPKWQD